MARKQKTSPFEDVVAIVSLLPWWVCLVLAVVSYFILHTLAVPDAVKPVNMQQLSDTFSRVVWKAFAMAGQFIVPVICLFASAVSAWRQFFGTEQGSGGVKSKAAVTSDGLLTNEFETSKVVSPKSILKGWSGEMQSTLAKKILLDSNVYEDINNVTIRISNGTTQIDHIIASRFGIFVVETKNMSGWIFGDENEAQWTQVLGAKKFKFQNPLRQNYKHVKALSEFLGIEEEKFFSVVMFWGEAELKTPMPPNVMTNGYIAYIKSQLDVVFTGEELDEIVAAIKTGMLPKTSATRREHIASLQARHTSKTTCPKCNSDLVLRTARSGANAGKQFFGCGKFPACRYVTNVEENMS